MPKSKKMRKKTGHEASESEVKAEQAGATRRSPSSDNSEDSEASSSSTSSSSSSSASSSATSSATSHSSIATADKNIKKELQTEIKQEERRRSASPKAERLEKPREKGKGQPSYESKWDSPSEQRRQRSRSRSKRRELSRDRNGGDRSREPQRSHGRERSKEPRRGNERNRSRERQRSNERDRSRERQRSNERERSRERQQNVRARPREYYDESRNNRGRERYADRRGGGDTESYRNRDAGQRFRRNNRSDDEQGGSRGRRNYNERGRGYSRSRSRSPRRSPRRDFKREGDNKNWRQDRASGYNRRDRAGSADGNHEWGKKTDEKPPESQSPVEKEKPNFGLSGALTEETNKVNGVVIKYSEPLEARKPKRRWRLYPFKGETALPTLHIHRQSCFLVGRDRKVVDLAVDHPSCSKQHAALQYRLVPFQRDDGSHGKRVRLYLIDLESANGTFLNNKKIDARKYYELMEKDVIKFGFSTREYVLLHENSKEDQEDDDVEVKQEPEDVAEEPNV